MADVQIKVREDGPLLVSGPVTLVDAEGNEYELPAGPAFTLCRCGASKNKPFCDKSHREIGFVAPSRAAAGG